MSQISTPASLTAYERSFDQYAQHLPFLVKATAENPGSTLNSAADKGGEDAVQALFDVLMDNGHRMVLVNALDSPAIPSWVREKLNVFLYGSRKQTAYLMRMH